MGEGVTRVGAQVPAQGVAAATGVVAHVALERLLPRVQLDVAQEVPLLGEGGAALDTVERPLTCRAGDGTDREREIERERERKSGFVRVCFHRRVAEI